MPVQLVICIGEEDTRKSAYKWIFSYLKDEMSAVFGQMWTSLPEDTFFFQKLKDIKRYYRHYTKEFRKIELDTKG